MKKTINVACGTVPKDGGTYSFYRNLRKGLEPRGIEVRCITVGSQENAIQIDDFVDEGCVALADDSADRKKQARQFVDWCVAESVDIVIPLNSVAVISALPHLPEHIRVISRCANAFDHGYRITVACKDRLARVVATAPRQFDDLTREYGVASASIELIPNSTDSARFAAAAAVRRGGGTALKLGFLGRLEHEQKGVLFLPAILGILRDRGVEFVMRIAGGGVHRKRLQAEIGVLDLDRMVDFVGQVRPEEVAEFLEAVDVLVFPSQFEGCPNVLLEAMSAGCVPVASRIEGITDWIIDDGQNGIVCDIGDEDGFADRLAMLAGDREIVARLSESASKKMMDQFSRESMAAKYSDLVHEVVVEPPPAWNPVPWSDFRVDPAFGEPSWKSLIPSPVKRVAMKALYKLGLSNRHE